MGGQRLHLPTGSDYDEADARRHVTFTPIAGEDTGQPQWTGTSWAAANAYGLKPLLQRTIITSTVLLFGLMVYYALVFLTWTFTFGTTFQRSNVPFYETSDLWRANSERFGVWWWLAALTLLRLITIFGSVSSIAHAAVTGTTAGVIAMKWWVVVYGIFDGGLFILYAITLVLHQCATVQFCRDFESGPGDPVDTAGQANVFYHVFVWFSLGFVVVHIIYGIWLTAAAKTVKEAKIEASRAMEADEEEPF